MPLGAVPGPQSHREFGLQLVAGVDQPIQCRALQQRRPVFSINKFLDTSNFAIRIDLRNAFTHGLYLGLAQRLGQRVNLAIDVRFGHMVQINQGQSANSAARQRFGRPGPHTANTDHRDMRVADRLGTSDSIEALQATKAPLRVERFVDESVSGFAHKDLRQSNLSTR